MTKQEKSVPAWTVVAHTSELSADGRLVVELLDRAILLLKVQSNYYAIDELCSHSEFSLEEGEIRSDHQIVCPMHGARFCLKTGEALSAPAYKNLKTYPIRIDENGQILIQLE